MRVWQRHTVEKYQMDFEISI